MSKKSSKPDIVIPVMGATGAGKSTFINHLAGHNVAKVGKTLSSCTENLQAVCVETDRYSRSRTQLVFLDTPGFDNSYGDIDIGILTKIVEWLESSYKEKKAVLGGVIYLHDIGTDRLVGTALRNIETFQRLYGQQALSRVMIATTKWSRIEEELAESHLQELKEVHWKVLVTKGARILRFRDTTESAWSLVDALISNARNQGQGNNITDSQRGTGIDNKALIHLSYKLRKYLCF